MYNVFFRNCLENNQKPMKKSRLQNRTISTYSSENLEIRKMFIKTLENLITEITTISTYSLDTFEMTKIYNKNPSKYPYKIRNTKNVYQKPSKISLP